MARKKELSKRDKILDLRQKSMDGRSIAINQGKEVAKFVVHDSYSADDKQAAATFKKPLLQYPVLLSNLTILMGNEQQARRVAKIIAHFWGDDQVMTILNNNYKLIIELTDLEYLLVQIFADGLIYPTGGWLRRSIVMDKMGYLTLDYETMDTFAVHPDPGYRKSDLSDCRYIVYDYWLTLDELKNKMRIGDLGSEKDKEWWKEKEGTFASIEDRAKNWGEFKKEDTYMYLEIEERTIIPINIVSIDGSDEFQRLTNRELRELRDKGMNAEVMVETTESRTNVQKCAPFWNNVVYDKDPNTVDMERYSGFCVTSYDFNMPKSGQTSWGYTIIDPQRRINKGMNQQVDFMSQILGAATFVLGYDGAAFEELKRTKGQPNPIIKLMGKNVPVKATMQNIPPEILQTLATDMGLIQEVSNISPAASGNAQRSGESGYKFDQMRDASRQATNVYYNVLSKVRENLGRDYVELVPKIYFEDDRIIPVKPEMKGGLTHEIVNLNYKGNIEKDVRNISARAILDEGENTPNMIKETFNENMAMLQLMQSSGATFFDMPWELLIEHSPVRDKEKWYEFISIIRKKQAGEAATNATNARMATLET